MNQIKAVIFDMDGLMIDSMMHWLKLDEHIFGECGVKLTEGMVKYMTGKSEKENISWLKIEHGINLSVEHLDKRRMMVDEIYSKKTQLMPGIINLVDKINKSECKQAIASGAPIRSVQKVVERFGWEDHFTILVSADDVDHTGKPDPRIFLHTAEKMGIKPEECIVFEDAENGVVAAKRAGMMCIAVPDKRWSFGVFDEADLIVDSLEDEQIFKLLGLN